MAGALARVSRFLNGEEGVDALRGGFDGEIRPDPVFSLRQI
jgi:hypothetical protein